MLALEWPWVLLKLEPPPLHDHSVNVPILKRSRSLTPVTSCGIWGEAKSEGAGRSEVENAYRDDSIDSKVPNYYTRERLKKQNESSENCGRIQTRAFSNKPCNTQRKKLPVF
jgi:hypothetical protein